MPAAHTAAPAGPSPFAGRRRAAILRPAGGAVAQSGEHHVRNVGVEGSNPFCSTNPPPDTVSFPASLPRHRYTACILLVSMGRTRSRAGPSAPASSPASGWPGCSCHPGSAGRRTGVAWPCLHSGERSVASGYAGSTIPLSRTRDEGNRLLTFVAGKRAPGVSFNPADLDGHPVSLEGEAPGESGSRHHRHDICNLQLVRQGGPGKGRPTSIMLKSSHPISPSPRKGGHGCASGAWVPAVAAGTVAAFPTGCTLAVPPRNL